MIPKYLSPMWSAVSPVLGNHLWQSTVFAVMAALLTLLLRKNHARTRYWLWLAASGKFLIPFSLLVGIGSHLSWLRGSPGSKAGLYFAMEGVSQPFTHPIVSMIPRVTASAVSPGPLHLLPALLTAAWLCGFVVVLFVWGLRWQRVSAAMRDGAPLREGREVEALRRLERIGGVRKQIEMLVSRTSLEPGIFGILRPVLIWPEGISERLEMHTWRPSSRMRCGTCVVATIFRLRYTWRWKLFSGFTPWFGGWERGWSKSANAPATRKLWNWGANGRSMPRAF
jgi:bla regulator protein BlaR1